MTQIVYLQKQLELLFESFGEDAVLRALEQMDGKRPPSNGAKRPVSKLSKQRKGRSAENLISKAMQDYPDKAGNVMRLGKLFQQGTFLPNTREISQFLERYTGERIRIDSRSKVFSRVLSVIAHLSEDEAKELAESAETRNPSSLGIISDAILSRE
jgi:uncharacterized protein with von Willebrand factor type A (vWA) domain